MKFKILAHGNTNPEKVLLVHKTAKFYAKYLNITKFKYKVYICLAPKLRTKDNVNGLCSKTGDREISVALDSQLDLVQALTTLAHEMVHVKQMVRGQYKSVPSRNGKLKRLWLGKQYSVKYSDRPWELEAFRREWELTGALLRNVAQKAKRASNNV